MDLHLLPETYHTPKAFKTTTGATYLLLSFLYSVTTVSVTLDHPCYDHKHPRMRVKRFPVPAFGHT